ncbi:MAG: AAA family ATPase [Candidatus Saccharimonas sp.]
MALVDYNYYSMRARKARVYVRLKGAGIVATKVLIAVLLVSGVACLVFGMAIGWFMIGLAALPGMVVAWYNGDLVHLPNGKAGDLTDTISGDILGQLPPKPTLLTVAQATIRVLSGQFMVARFGLTGPLLQSFAEASNVSMDEFWQKAEAIRKTNQLDRITGSVLAATIIRSTNNYQQILAQIQLDDEDLDSGIQWQYHLRQLILLHRKPVRTGGVARDWSFGYIPLLTRFGQNISEQISRGRQRLLIETTAHRDAIDMLMETFGSGGRQNAILVGMAGSGKTAIIHAFAAKLLDADAALPDSLRFRQVFILDSSAIIGAAPGRGELEDLVMRLFSEAYSAKNIILCLDNAQLFFEEGVGAVDLTNVLQPILEAGNLRVILSMDEQRYLQISSRNPGLVNALNRISVPSASKQETLVVMQEQLIKTEFERNVTYMYQAIKEAYRLSERYVHDLAMPGRAIKLLESAASYSEGGMVTVNSVQQAIEKTLDVKVSVASSAEDREALLHLEERIHERMVNQVRAVGVVSDALRRARTGVRNENRPIGTFLFLGPTGVGKTELSKALAEVYFGGEQRLVRLDLNEYVRPEDVARLIADGADDPSSLTAQVMKQPFSVVLLDEIEKAAPEVLSTLLQLLDEGILRDVKNREISFRDAIVIATSNAGADRIREFVDRGYSVEQFEPDFINELISSNQFRPEFLNRFDEIVVFRPFTKDELLQVLDLILAGVNKTLEVQKVSVEVDPDAKAILVEKGYDPRLGARPMRRVVQKAVENTIAKKMLSGSVQPGDCITISAEQIAPLFASEGPVKPA